MFSQMLFIGTGALMCFFLYKWLRLRGRKVSFPPTMETIIVWCPMKQTYINKSACELLKCEHLEAEFKAGITCRFGGLPTDIYQTNAVIYLEEEELPLATTAASKF